MLMETTLDLQWPCLEMVRALRPGLLIIELLTVILAK